METEWTDDAILHCRTREEAERLREANIGRLAECPGADCSGCAGATCVINQGAERDLRSQVTEWLQEHAEP